MTNESELYVEYYALINDPDPQQANSNRKTLEMALRAIRRVATTAKRHDNGIFEQAILPRLSALEDVLDLK